MGEKNQDEEGIIPGEKAAEGARWRHYLKVFAVKPVTIFYGMSFVVTNSVDAQLWLDRQVAKYGIVTQVLLHVSHLTEVKSLLDSNSFGCALFPGLAALNVATTPPSALSWEGSQALAVVDIL